MGEYGLKNECTKCIVYDIAYDIIRCMMFCYFLIFSCKTPTHYWGAYFKVRDE